MMWPSVKNLPDNYNPQQDLSSLSSILGQGQADYFQIWRCLALQTSFRFWVGAHELLFARALSGNVAILRYLDDTSRPPVGGTHIDRVLASYALSRKEYLVNIRTLVADATAISWYPFFPSSSLRFLGPGDSAETLSWATEYLSQNIAGCNLPVHSSREIMWQLHRCHWPEADGGLGTFDYYAEQAGPVDNRHLMGAWIIDPNARRHDMDAFVARGWILFSPHSQLVTGSTWGNSTTLDRMSSVSSFEMRELTYFVIAMNRPRNIAGIARHAEFRDRVYTRWATKLLRRYIGVAMKKARWGNQDIELQFCVRCVRMLLDFVNRTHGHDPNPPRWFYDEMWDYDCTDLYIPLAWMLRFAWIHLSGEAERRNW